MRKRPRIIIADIETLPDLPEALKVWTQLSNFPGRTFKATINSIACFGYRVAGTNESRVISAWDYKGWDSDVNDDRQLVRDAARILKTADIVVTQNGDRFDIPFIQTRLMKNKLSRLPEIFSVDTKKEAKRQMSAFSNSLNYLAEQFTDVRKMENEGWPLWIKVHGRDQEAMKTMAIYCAQDLVATEALFDVLRLGIKKFPNMNQFFLEEDRCTNCGNQTLRKAGTRTLKERFVQRLQCITCGSWMNQTIKGLVRGQS